MTDAEQLLRQTIGNQEYIGHRPALWDEQTSVTFDEVPAGYLEALAKRLKDAPRLPPDPDMDDPDPLF